MMWGVPKHASISHHVLCQVVPLLANDGSLDHLTLIHYEIVKCLFCVLILCLSGLPTLDWLTGDHLTKRMTVKRGSHVSMSTCSPERCVACQANILYSMAAFAVGAPRNIMSQSNKGG